MPVCLYNTPSQQQHLETEDSSDDCSEGFDDIIAAKQVECGSMPCWYYDKKELRNSPSIRDGISLETERRYRKEGARFIMSCGTQMGLGHNTMATGVVYFHRFYMFHSFRTFPRYVTACCCLFLAGKVEETPKKCRDVIKTARNLLDDNHFYSFGEDPKEEVMNLERVLLQTIKFDLQVEHPYSFLLKYAKCFKGDQQKLQKMVQMAWNFVNDSLSTTVSLQWEPEIIAVALIHLASKLSKFVVSDWNGREARHLRWWDMFVEDVTMEILEDVCHQVLDLYQKNQKEDTDGSNSPPQKPPSRADSPTPLVKQPYDPPQQQQQQQQQQMDISYQQQAHYDVIRNNKQSSHNAPSTPTDVQPIKSLANTSHRYQQSNSYYGTEMYTPPPLPSQSMHMPMQYASTPPPPPPPVSNAANVSRTIPLPPLPPMPPPSGGFYGHMPVMGNAPAATSSSSGSQYTRVGSLAPPATPSAPNGGLSHMHEDYYHHSYQSYRPSNRARQRRRNSHRY